MPEDLAAEVVTDLFRSAWLVESARARVFAAWGLKESADRAIRRSEMVAAALSDRNRAVDAALVEPHARWIFSLAGTAPDEVPLSHLFLIRLGDWVEAHCGPFLNGSSELVELGAAEKQSVVFPSELPSPPPYEPYQVPEVRPPGEVRFRIGILGDLHAGSPSAEQLIRAAIADLNASGAEVVIQLGDMTDHGDKDEYELAAKLLGELEMPCTTMIGNHDVYSIKEERLAGREFYPASFGREPDGVLLEHKGFRLAVLDSAEHGASPFAPFDIVTGTFVEGPGGAIVRGSLTIPQHKILAEIAEPNSPPAFVFLHHPPQPFTAFPPIIFGLRDADSGRLHATCDSGNVWGVFAGHTHRNARSREFDGVPAQEVAIPRDYPFGYATIDVADNGYAYRFHQISDTDLVRDAHRRAGKLLRRYAGGRVDERAFVWRR